MFRPLVDQALSLHRRGIVQDGPFLAAGLLRERYGDAAELFTEDSGTLTILREIEKEMGHGGE